MSLFGPQKEDSQVPISPQPMNLELEEKASVAKPLEQEESVLEQVELEKERALLEKERAALIKEKAEQDREMEEKKIVQQKQLVLAQMKEKEQKSVKKKQKTEEERQQKELEMKEKEKKQQVLEKERSEEKLKQVSERERKLQEKKEKLDSKIQEKKLSNQLSDVERTYREGLTTLKDLIAPASLKFENSYFEINGKFARSFFVLTYPRFLSTNWLASMIQSEGTLDISMFIYPIDSATILKKLRSKVGEIGSQISIDQDKGKVRDPMLETAYKDVESLRDNLMQGTERYFRFALYFTIYSDTLKELNKDSATLESALGSKLIVTKRALMQTRAGLNSTLPLGIDELDVSNNMNTSPLSSAFPFVSSDLTGNDGILYGINRHNNSLILFDRFAMENANSVVFAKSGAGKSYAIKLEILRSLMVGVDVIVIDPENEYKHLADAVGGTYLNVSLNSDSRINPFDLPIGLEGEDNNDIIRSAVINLLGLFNLMLGKLNPTEEAVLDKALWQTYAKKDITPEIQDFRTVEVPTMDDLVEILKGTVGAESLAQRLTKFTEGTFAGLFNQPSNVVLNNQLVVFSIRDLEDELRPIAMYIVLNYIWNIVRSELKKRILAIDEAWIMMQHEDSARFVFGIAKRARKYYLGLITITQDVADFMASPYGKPIVTNSSMQLLLKQSPAAIKIITETFFLTEGEKYLLLESEVGEGIFFAGLKHAAIKIYASYVEDQIITTDPKQLLKIKESQDKLE